MTQLKSDLWVFPPNIASNNCRSWWIDCCPEPVLIDCPPYSDKTVKQLIKLSSGRKGRILLTNRDSHGRIRELQKALNWPITLQEQEAYLLPELEHLETFAEEHVTISGIKLLWTPGPTPGSSIVYAPAPLNVVFCGRLLFSNKLNQLFTLRNKRTFHWPSVQNSLQKLQDWIPSDSFPGLASGVSANPSIDGKVFLWKDWQKPI